MAEDLPAPGAREDAPSADLLAAVERASRHVGGEGPEGGPVLRFDAPRAGARRVRVLAVILAVSVIGAALSVLLPSPKQSEQDVEADLRWAVANVVREVEAFRVRTGALPDPERLRILAGEHVVYEPVGELYLVTGERDRVRVTYDGTVPLEEWVRRRDR